MGRALGGRAGWLTGRVIVVADVIVMASLAQIAASYSFQLVGAHGLVGSQPALIIAGSLWILLMTWIAWRGIELSARTQYLLLGAELLILALVAVVAVVKVYSGTAGEQAITISWSWFNPFTLPFGALSAGFLLAVFIYWGWGSAVTANEETADPSVNPGRAAVLSTLVLLQKVILPLLGALVLCAAFVKTAIDLLDPEAGDTRLLGIGGAFVYGIGSILIGVVLMIVYNIVAPQYFRGNPATLEGGRIGS